MPTTTSPRHLRTLLLISCLLASMPGTALADTIAGGWGHTVMVRPDGTVWTWGANNNGQLGDVTQLGQSTPWQVHQDSVAWWRSQRERHTISR